MYPLMKKAKKLLKFFFVEMNQKTIRIVYDDNQLHKNVFLATFGFILAKIGG